MTAEGKQSAIVLALLALILTVLGTMRWRERFRSDRLAITFFDVGQGDASLIQFPGGRTLLVDAGGGFGERDVGRRELYRELLRFSVLRLDVAFLSHPDQDHAYGFSGLLAELPIGELWIGSSSLTPPRKPLLDELRHLAALQRVPVRAWALPSRTVWGGVTVTVLPVVAGEGSNDRSMALRLDYAGCSALFTGDLEMAGEQELVRLGGSAAASLSLLKVAHHGSATSSTTEFLRATRPRWAVISVGAGNRYGHPRPEVVERLHSAGARVFRTDFHGYVRFEIHGDGSVTCQSAQGDCGQASCTK